jgi:receptor protein-tyrosine kinase
MSVWEHAASIFGRRLKAAGPDPGSAQPALDAVAEIAAGQAGRPATVQFREIDFKVLHARGMVCPETDSSQVAEEFRLIKQPLIAKAFGQGAARIPRGNLILVTSARTGEGKTFCATNLAISLAMEMNRTILLVDLDMMQPKAMTMLGVQAEHGLLDVLQDARIAMSDVLIRTNLAKLMLLPSGRPYQRGAELLASPVMLDLVTEMGARYDDRLIVFDAPSLLETPEVAQLAARMGQVVVVVEAGRTSRETLRKALDQLDACENVSMLLNKASPHPAG